ncbi:MAG: LysR family transcriptional regulator [Rhodocyclaceae bacterium]|nr:LysR family transcriptional regulator [Rhodocyclaceae bacterium]
MGTNDFLEVLPEMVTFVRVAERGSFSAAAVELQITPSAASRRVSRLEKVLGLQLIRRTTRQLRLTDAGNEAFEKCSELVVAAQGAMQVAQRFMERPQGLIRVSAPKAFAKHVLHPLILDFLNQYLAVDVQLLVTDNKVDPIHEGVDLVVQVTKYPPENLASRRLMQAEHIICASPEFLEKTHPIHHPNDLIGLSCLYLGEKEKDNWWRFCKGEEVVDVLVKGRYVANHSEIRLNAIEACMGVGCVPDFVARQALVDGKVKRILADWEFEANYHGTVHILYPQNRFLAPKCRVFIDFLAERIGARYPEPVNFSPA